MPTTIGKLNRESIEECRICDGELVELFPFGDTPKVVRCKDCRTESIRPLPTPEELADHYSGYPLTRTSDDQTLRLVPLAIETLKFYLAQTDLRSRPPPSIRFLEMGFGNGAGLWAGSKLGLQTYGVDLDPLSVSNAVAFADEHSLAATCVHGDVKALRSLDVKFDIVKASQVLEHVLDPVEFLSDIARAQTAGAYLIIECPNNDATFWQLKNRTRKMFGRLNYYNSLKLREHLWGYTKTSLPMLLKRAGYRTVMVRDYAAGNAIFEPESVLWYPTLATGLRYSIAHRTWGPFMYAGVRAFDSIASGLWHKGTGLAVLCQRQDSVD